MVAIDLGSNTIRAVEFDCENNIIIKEKEKIVKTADNLANTREIDENSINRIIEAILEFKKEFNFNNVVAVATQALREAKNSQYVIDKIKELTGIEFKVITAEEEAKYTAIAVKECLNKKGFETKSFILCDIGGGSTELSLYKKDSIITESINLGIVTITQRHKTPDAIKIAIKKRVKQFKEFINLVYATYSKPKIFVASSGTPTTIAALKANLNYKTYNKEIINGMKINLDDINYWEDKLLKMPMKKREELVGVGRGDLIVSGIYILKEIMKLCEFKECIVCDDGLREGVAIASCKMI